MQHCNTLEPLKETSVFTTDHSALNRAQTCYVSVHITHHFRNSDAEASPPHPQLLLQRIQQPLSEARNPH